MVDVALQRLNRGGQKKPHISARLSKFYYLNSQYYYLNTENIKILRSAVSLGKE